MGGNWGRGLVVEYFGYVDGVSNFCIMVREFGKFGVDGKIMNEWNLVFFYKEFVVLEFVVVG